MGQFPLNQSCTIGLLLMHTIRREGILMSVLLTNTLHRVAKYFHHHPPPLRKKQTAKKCLEAESCLGDFFFVSSHIEREKTGLPTIVL